METKNVFQQLKLLINHYSFALMSLLTITLLFLRRPDQLRHPQFWAEDGSLFFEAAEQLGLHSLFQSYAGYFHTYQRIIAYLATFFSPALAPTLYVGATVAMVIFVIYILYRPENPMASKFPAVLSLALLPHIGEVFLQLVNIQFYMAVGGLVLLLMGDIRTPIFKNISFFAVLLFSLTGPFMILWLPISIFYHCYTGWSRQKLWRHTIPLLAVLLIATSLFYAPTSFGIKGQNLADLSDYILFMGRRTFGELIAEPYAFYKTFNHWISVGVFIAVGASCFWTWRKKQIPLPLVFFACATLVLAAAAFKERYNAPYIRINGFDRYSFAPNILLIACLFEMAKAYNRRIAIIAILLFLNTLRVSIKSESFVVDRPDLHWKTKSSCLNQEKKCFIPIHPRGWQVQHPGRWSTDQ